MKNGLRAFDSDMHVYDPAFLYEKYMNPKWGERIPRGQRNGKHGRVEFQLGGGTKLSDFRSHRSRAEASRAVTAPWSEIMTPCPKCRRWIWKDWTLVCSFAPRRFIVMTASRRSMPTTQGVEQLDHRFCKENPSRLKASALITLHDVDLAIEEVRRVE